MKSLNGWFDRITNTTTGQLSLVLAVFLVYRLLSLGLFYEGFLKLFPRIDLALFGKASLLSWVPYHQPSIVFGALLHPLFLLGLILFYLPLFFRRRVAFQPSFRFLPAERLLLFVCAFLLTWELTGYDYNYFLDRPFYLDRAALIALTLLLPRFPLLAPLFVAFAYVYRSQFNYPVDGFPLYDKRLLFDLLVLFIAQVYARLYIRAFKISYLFLAICLLASGYVAGGVAKFLISPHGYEWLWKNNPGDLFYNSHLRGWLGGASDQLIQSLGYFFSRYGKFFQALACMIELSALWTLRSRKTGIVIFSALLAMHLGIFLLAGIFFWKWMVVDLVMLGCYLYKNGQWVNELFWPQTYRASLAVICLSFAWLQPIPFGWHDTPANQYFSYEVEDDQGHIYTLQKNEMNPYHQWFQIDRFLFLVNKRTLPLTGFGYAYKYKLAKAISQAGPAYLQKLEQQQGKNVYQLRLKTAYERFIQTYFRNRNKRLYRTFIPSYWMAPLHLYTNEQGPAWKGNTPVRRFRVYLNQTYTIGGVSIRLNHELVDEITIRP